MQNRTGTEPIQKVRGQHIAQNDEDEGRCEETIDKLQQY